jgi:hypothetical protein
MAEENLVEENKRLRNILLELVDATKPFIWISEVYVCRTCKSEAVGLDNLEHAADCIWAKAEKESTVG